MIRLEMINGATSSVYSDATLDFVLPPNGERFLNRTWPCNPATRPDDLLTAAHGAIDSTAQDFTNKTIEAIKALSSVELISLIMSHRKQNTPTVSIGNIKKVIDAWSKPRNDTEKERDRMELFWNLAERLDEFLPPVGVSPRQLKCSGFMAHPYYNFRRTVDFASKFAQAIVTPAEMTTAIGGEFYQPGSSKPLVDAELKAYLQQVLPNILLIAPFSIRKMTVEKAVAINLYETINTSPSRFLLLAMTNEDTNTSIPASEEIKKRFTKGKDPLLAYDLLEATSFMPLREVYRPFWQIVRGVSEQRKKGYAVHLDTLTYRLINLLSESESFGRVNLDTQSLVDFIETVNHLLQTVKRDTQIIEGKKVKFVSEGLTHMILNAACHMVLLTPQYEQYEYSLRETVLATAETIGKIYPHLIQKPYSMYYELVKRVRNRK